MLKYLKAAFWAGPRVPLLGSLPVNALAVAAGIIFGFVQPAIWFLTLGIETAWLFALSTNARFQRWADLQDAPPPLPAGVPDQELSPGDLRQAAELQAKVSEALAAYQRNQTDPLIFEANKDALRRLAEIHGTLLGARASLLEAQRRTDAAELRSQLAGIERDLAQADLAPAVRGSKQATAEILRQRLGNDEKRRHTLELIDADLVRIEAQVDLAVENAVVRGSTEALSSNIELTSQLLTDGGVSSSLSTAEISLPRSGIHRKGVTE